MTEFLDGTPLKCVGLDREFTDTLQHVRRKDLPPKKRQRAAVLQLSVAYETLVFQICYANAVPDLFRQFLSDKEIMFSGATICNDDRMLKYYGLSIATMLDLQKAIPNPTLNNPPGLYNLANYYIGANPNKNCLKVKKYNLGGWEQYPLKLKRVKYATLDARLGFEITRRCQQLVGYNTNVDPLNVD